MKRLTASVVMIGVLVSGCATVPDSERNPRDPMERLNRTIFDVNDKIDEIAVQPIARQYQELLPSFVQTGIANFFGNIGDVWTLVNNFLQGNVQDGLTDMMRVGVNTTFGFAGILDIASEARIPKHRRDFGQTLGVWGVPAGPYVVIPFLGPSTLRDAVAEPIDSYGNPWAYARPIPMRKVGTAIALVNKRAGLLDATSLLEDAALDKYIFVRDAYLQRRDNQIKKRSEDALDRKEENAAAAERLEEKPDDTPLMPEKPAQQPPAEEPPSP